MKHSELVSASSMIPQGEIEPSAFHDAEAEAVREKAREESREESERVDMGMHDERKDLPTVEDDPTGVDFGAVETLHEADLVEIGDEVHQEPDTGGASSAADGGTAAPSTPICPDIEGPLEVAIVPQTPRASPTARAHEDDDDADIEEHQSKRLKNEDSKRARIQRIAEEFQLMSMQCNVLMRSFIQWTTMRLTQILNGVMLWKSYQQTLRVVEYLFFVVFLAFFCHLVLHLFVISVLHFHFLSFGFAFHCHFLSFVFAFFCFFCSFFHFLIVFSSGAGG